jgi:arylsulfatase A-like enzyme
VSGAIAWAVIWLPLLLGVASCRPHAEPPPHVVVVSVDTLNRDALRAFAPAARPLPALDSFAEESIRFIRAYSTASWTLPAHASLLTGLYPDRHGANRETRALRIGVRTLAEELRWRGYQTVAFTDEGFLNARYGFSRGFDRYDGRLGEGAAATGIDLPRDGKSAEVRGADLFDRAIAFLSQRPARARPLFLFLHTYTVHDYFEQRDWALARLEDPTPVEDPPYLRCLRGSERCSPHHWDRLEALYRAELEHFDAGFGRLVAALERAELWEQSVVFLLSDHGEGFDMERGRIHHGGRLHADQLHIPLLVRVPGQTARDETAPVSLVDLMPTLLDLTGTRPVGDLDGRSFAATLRGEKLPDDARPLYSMEHHYIWSDEGVRLPGQGAGRRPHAVAVIEGPYWYIRGFWSEELYDMRTDRLQRRNLAPEAAGLESYRQLVARRSVRETAPNPIEPDEELSRQLRSLGYAE